MDSPQPGLDALPLDVLLKIFSYLPLRALLRVESLCHSLQEAVFAHFSSLRHLDLHDNGVLRDEFLPFEDSCKLCRALNGGNIARLLARCQNVTTIAFLPACSSNPPYVDAVEAIVELFRGRKGGGGAEVRELELCNSWELAERLLAECPHVAIGELQLEGRGTTIRLPSNCRVRRLNLRGVKLEQGLPCLNETEEVSLSRVTLHMPAEALLLEGGEVQRFHRLRSFSFSGTTFARDHVHLRASTVSLLLSLAAGPSLETLRLHMAGFDELVDVCRAGGFPRLRRLELSTSGWAESSSPQQLHSSATAGVVAELCALSRVTLTHLSLPSVVLVKQFVVYLLSHDVWFPNLETLEVSDKIYDTKFFLAPFNFIEDRAYADFVQRFPRLASLSLHSYAGSPEPRVLPLPLHLTHLTLPWDSRRPSSLVGVASAVGSLPLLTHLHVQGVESVEGVGEAAKVGGGSGAGGVVVKLDNPQLEVVRISNVCCSKILLTGCHSLREFALQCCPALRSLALPPSVTEVRIYDEGRPYMMKFVEAWLSQLKQNSVPHTTTPSPSHPPPLHRRLHIQLHSIHKVGGEVPPEVGKGLLPETVLGFSRSLHYLVLYRHPRRELHHTSRESMYACTEFQPQSEFNPGSDPRNEGREEDGGSGEEVARENEHRKLVYGGMSRWLQYLSAPPTPTEPNLPKFTSISAGDRSEFEALFCGQLYNVYTNMPGFVEANLSPYMTQPSCRGGGGGKEIKVLNVPRWGLPPIPLLSKKPLVCVTVMEYLHHISHPRE